MSIKKAVSATNQIRKLHTSRSLTSSKNPKNHYDSLGITQKATQGDVKSAYYNLSKVYHPDKSKGNQEHLQKFRDISEAYEVLGNVKTRKMYDKGFYVPSEQDVTSAEDPLHKFYKSRERRSQVPPWSGRTPIYDFDEWSKAHYETTFKRSRDFKQHAQTVDSYRREQKEELETKLLCIFIITVIVSGVIYIDHSGYDNVKTPQRTNNSSHLD
ncbi:dnaJ homolog subfamily C member 30, mitochondrial-like [Cylas formicarius]|uniref:dnaJ homolog subfamily C member 30, mitochondrial-like n=1 Tax=Cylas formicarius TaxID=197179 RepID=UPI002958763B|nr:dnaJ homolog subfamily C member 30, mitochondrial-like [Cylas formicarius]